MLFLDSFPQWGQNGSDMPSRITFFSFQKEKLKYSFLLLYNYSSSERNTQTFLCLNTGKSKRNRPFNIFPGNLQDDTQTCKLADAYVLHWYYVQVNNYEIVVNFFHIRDNLTWYSVIVHKFTRNYPVCSTYELTKQFM